VSIVTFCLFDKNIVVQLAKRNTVQIEKRIKNLVFMFLVLIKSEKKLLRKSCFKKIITISAQTYSKFNEIDIKNIFLDENWGFTLNGLCSN
jgi:hypothetical protein